MMSPLHNDMFMEASSDINTMDKREISKQLFAQINWQDILRAGVFLSLKEHQLLDRAQENLPAVMDHRLESQMLAKILLKMADNCTSNVPVLQYVFTRVQEILGLIAYDNEFDPESYGVSRAKLFTDDGVRLHDGVFLRALHSSDPYTKQAAASALGFLLTKTEGDMRSFCFWLCENLANNPNTLEVTVPILTTLLRRAEAREIFISCGGIRVISIVLSKIGPNGNAQHIYELTFALWTCTLAATASDKGGVSEVLAKRYGMPTVEDFDYHAFLQAGTIPLLSDLLAAAPSRKVVRMALATLRNLATLQQEEVLTEMLNVGLDRQLETFIGNNAHKQANDVEVENDSRMLHEILQRNYRDLSTFEKWKSEMNTGALRWGIVHTEKFWRENARFMEFDDFHYVKSIIDCLAFDKPVTTIAIALYDLGEFTRFYPNGRGVTKSLGGRDKAMGFINHSNPDIQRHALQCVSKLMISNWDHLR